MREQEILRLAAEHFHAATDGKEIPDYGRWSDWVRVMRNHIDGFGSATEDGPNRPSIVVAIIYPKVIAGTAVAPAGSGNSAWSCQRL